MMEAVRNGAWAKSGGGVPTARDYVQDGLIAMWDGIENAGFGVHDPNATVWKDLVGDTFGDIDVGVAHDKYWDMTGVSKVFEGTFGLDITVEIGIFEPQNFTVRAIPFYLGSAAPLTSGTSSFCGLYRNSLTFFYKANASTGTSLYNTSEINKLAVSISTNEIGCVGYVNGELKSSANIFGGVDLSATFNMATVCYNGVRTASKLMFIRVYSGTLSEIKVLQNYAIDKARFNLT